MNHFLLPTMSGSVQDIIALLKRVAAEKASDATIRAAFDSQTSLSDQEQPPATWITVMSRGAQNDSYLEVSIDTQLLSFQSNDAAKRFVKFCV